MVPSRRAWTRASSRPPGPRSAGASSTPPPHGVRRRRPAHRAPARGRRGRATAFGLLGSFGIAPSSWSGGHASSASESAASPSPAAGSCSSACSSRSPQRAAAVRAREEPENTRPRPSTACRSHAAQRGGSRGAPVRRGRRGVPGRAALLRLRERARQRGRLRQAPAPQLPRARRARAACRGSRGGAHAAVPDRGPRARYSWYQRIAFGRPIESALTGSSGSRRRRARQRRRAPAGRPLAREIPRFGPTRRATRGRRRTCCRSAASRPRLKHLLGDPAVVRRAIEAHVHSEVTA